MAELDKIMELLSGDEGLAGALKSDTLPDLSDIAMITKAMSAIKGSADDDGARLLRDLKPYISARRRKRVDEAVMILRLLRVAGTLEKGGELTDEN